MAAQCCDGSRIMSYVQTYHDGTPKTSISNFGVTAPLEQMIFGCRWNLFWSGLLLLGLSLVQLSLGQEDLLLCTWRHCLMMMAGSLYS
jgi:hypothetical protein